MRRRTQRGLVDRRQALGLLGFAGAVAAGCRRASAGPTAPDQPPERTGRAYIINATPYGMVVTLNNGSPEALRAIAQTASGNRGTITETALVVPYGPGLAPDILAHTEPNQLVLAGGPFVSGAPPTWLIRIDPRLVTGAVLIRIFVDRLVCTDDLGSSAGFTAFRTLT